MMKITHARILGVVFLFCFVAAGGCTVSETAPSGAKAQAVSVDEALSRLKAGNQRFVSGSSVSGKDSVQRRAELTKGQAPFAIIVSCSDSRVAPEIVFDQGHGEIFVVRTAGQVVDDVPLGSIEYGAAQLNAPCIVVLGHQHCGAVSATVAGGKVPGHIQAIVDAIRPAVGETKGQPGDPLNNAICANVRRIVKKLQKSEPILSPLVKGGKLKVVGAIYSLDTGRVEWLP